jgi:hypothetical protein
VVHCGNKDRERSAPPLRLVDGHRDIAVHDLPAEIHELRLASFNGVVTPPVSCPVCQAMGAGGHSRTMVGLGQRTRDPHSSVR